MRQLLSDPLSRSGARLMRTRLTRLLGTAGGLRGFDAHSLLCRRPGHEARAFGIAGEGIRTLDVQLGKLAFYH